MTTRKMTDEQFEAFKGSVNETIHELVFAVQYADNDEVEEALNCLMTASGTLERVAEDLANGEVVE